MKNYLIDILPELKIALNMQLNYINDIPHLTLIKTDVETITIIGDTEITTYLNKLINFEI